MFLSSWQLSNTLSTPGPLSLLNLLYGIIVIIISSKRLVSTFGCAAVQGTVRATEMNKTQMYSRRRGLGFECLSSREESTVSQRNSTPLGPLPPEGQTQIPL